MILVAVCSTAAAKLPGQADQLLPILRAEADKFWPSVAPREWLPALVDQESGWKLKATLRTKRELGCGLGQFTKAYTASGAVRFDALTDTKRLDPSLAAWSWRDCYNAQFQLRAVVLKLRVNDRQCSVLMHGEKNTRACDAAMYNGGGGSVVKRIRLCKMDRTCDAHVWAGNLEIQGATHDGKVTKGYGESFWTINSKYPGRVEAREFKFLGK